MRVVIENYQIIEHIEFEIQGITILSGKSNNGKSSCYRAIRALCFGQLGDFFVRSGNEQCRIRLDIDNHKFGWSRGKEAVFYLDGKPYTNSARKPPEDFTQLLNIKEIELAKFDLAPNFASQFDPLFLVGLTPPQAASALSYLFSGEKFPELLKMISKSIKETKKDIDFIEGSLDQLGRDVKANQERRDGLAKYLPWISRRKQIQKWYLDMMGLQTGATCWATLSREIQGITAGVNKVGEIVRKLDGVKAEIISRQESLSLVVRQWRDHEASIESGRKDLLENSRKLQYLASISQAVVNTFEGLKHAAAAAGQYGSEMRALRYTVEAGQKKLDLLRGLDPVVVSRAEGLASAQVAWKSFDVQVLDYSNSVSSDQRTIKKLDLEINRVLDSITDCPYCRNLLDAEHRAYLLSSGAQNIIQGGYCGYSDARG
jgi:hypothetical protein